MAVLREPPCCTAILMQQDLAAVVGARWEHALTGQPDEQIGPRRASNDAAGNDNRAGS
jgi:hypothetical protein